MYKYKCLIIGDDHYNTLNVIRSLGRSNIIPEVLIVSNSPKSFVLKSKYISRGLIVNKITPEIIIENFSDSECKLPVITTSDSCASFLDRHYNTLSNYFILPSINLREGELVKCMDKNLQLLVASTCGFSIPFSQSIDPNNKELLPNEDFKFPCLVKPENSYLGSKKDFRICYNITDLQNVINGHVNKHEKILVQEFIPNDNVILIAGVRTLDKNNYIFGEIDKIKISLNIDSLGLNCFGKFYSFTYLKDKCDKLLDKLNYFGLYSIELLRVRDEDCLDSYRDYFVEINLRTDGLLYFFNKTGINFPEIWVKSCYKIPINPIILKRDKTFGMNEFLYLRNCLSFKSLSDFIRTDSFSTFDFNDLKPFFFKFIYHG